MVFPRLRRDRPRSNLIQRPGPPFLQGDWHRHSTMMKNSQQKGWVVQKFGGTSVGKFPINIADIIR